MSRSLPHSKLLHKRDSDKVDGQEENFLPKYQRVKDLCQRAEYQTACEQLGQVRKRAGALDPDRYPSALPSFLPSAAAAACSPGLPRGPLASRASEASASQRWYFAAL